LRDTGLTSPTYRISSSRELQFIIILNPNSGPGKSPWWPNHDYTREIPKLNAYKNVTTIGYVPIDYCRRDLKEVYTDVSDYASWRADPNLPGCYVDGIFFDESPQTATSDHLSFMQQVSTFARQTLTRGSTTLFNVGALPDSEFWGLADYINVFEGTEIDLRNVNLTAGVVGFASQATVIVQSYRSNETQLSKNVRDILGVNNGAGFAGLFVSDWGLYDAFSSLWNGFAGDFDLARMSNS
jgi:hypothetical protein